MVRPRILVSSRPDIVLISCEIWNTIFYTCTIDYVGIGLQTLIPRAFKMFAKWYKWYKINSPSHLSLLYVVNAVSIIMQHNPDLCAESLQRHRHITKRLLKSCYKHYANHAPKALNGFLLQCMYVNMKIFACSDLPSQHPFIFLMFSQKELFVKTLTQFRVAGHAI